MDDRELDMIIRLAYKDKTITQRHKKSPAEFLNTHILPPKTCWLEVEPREMRVFLNCTGDSDANPRLAQSRNLTVSVGINRMSDSKAN